MDTMVEPKRRRFTIAEYHRMGEAGGYRRPSPEGYAESRVFQDDDLLSIQAFPDVTFTVRALLG